ncbi:MAG: SPOR domain-containing protein [Hyphomicrobium sp.]
MAKLTPETPLAAPPTFERPSADRSPFTGTVARPRRSIPVFTPYVVIWTMFGMLSLGYMSIAGMAPDWLDDLSPASRAIEAQNAQPEIDVAVEIGALRDGVAQLQDDMARIKADVETSVTRQASLETQVATIDQRLAGQSNASTQSPDGRDGAAPPQMPKLINADDAAPAAPALETGSVGKISAAAAKAAKPAPVAATVAASPAPVAPPVIQQPADVAFGPAVVKPAPKQTGLQIASANSIENLRVNWAVLTENYGTELQNLEPRYATKGDPANPSYDLVVGPMKSKAEAIKACKALAAKSVPCKVGDFIGNAL